MTAAESRAPRKRFEEIATVASLQAHLQWAMCVELSTIPPYLCAAYSIQDNTSEAYRFIVSVAFEEMLHMMLVSNLMNAIGASPKLSGDFVARYPGYIPHHAAGGPFIQLQPYSPALLKNTFMGIEQPEGSPRAPAEGDEFQTIGQFYKAIDDGFDRVVHRLGPEQVFGHDTGFQATDTYFGMGGGRLLGVKDLASAHAAIKEIVLQGEGAVRPETLGSSSDPFGGKNHYGNRVDGTFGPILGTPWELSHYYKFQRLADAASQPSVFPMAPNPDTERLGGWLRELSELFDNAYTLLLVSLESALGAAAEKHHFFGASFPAMQFLVTPLATLLVQTPLADDAPADLGPNAGPSFQYRPAPVAAMIERTRHLLSQLEAVQKARGTDYAYSYKTILGGALATLLDIAAGLEGTAR
jgi:hypothetical protein